jgi:hypothetical protein
MPRRPLRSQPQLLDAAAPAEAATLPEPAGPIDLAKFTRRLYRQALRVLAEIEDGHEAMAVDDQCKLLNTLGVLGKNMVALVKGSGQAARRPSRALDELDDDELADVENGEPA